MAKLCSPISSISIHGVKILSIKEGVNYLTIKVEQSILILTETVAGVNPPFLFCQSNFQSKVYCRDTALGWINNIAQAAYPWLICIALFPRNVAIKVFLLISNVFSNSLINMNLQIPTATD